MKVQKSTAISPTYGAIYSSSDIKDTPKQREIMDNIAKKLNKPYMRDLKFNSYLKMFENSGFDIFYSNGSTEDSLRVDLISRSRGGKTFNFGDMSKVGEYTRVGEYDNRDAMYTYMQYNGTLKNYIYRQISLFAASVLALGFLAYMHFKPTKHSMEYNSQTLVTDTVLNLQKSINQDSIPIIK